MLWTTSLSAALVLAVINSEKADVGAVITAFVDVHVITMESDAVLPHQTVIVRGDRIDSIGPAGQVEIPENANRIESSGRYLAPGLIDLHVHIQDEVDAELYVLNGVSTVRECNGSPWSIWQKNQIESGQQLGPAVHVTSPPIIGFGQGLAGSLLQREARRFAQSQLNNGYEFLKIYDDITPEAYEALVLAARDVGIRPMGHIPRNLTLEQVLKTPPDSIAHAEEFLYAQFFPDLDETTIPAVTRLVVDSKIAVIATLVTYDHIGRQVADLSSEFDRPEARYATALQLRDWGPTRNRHRHFDPASAPRFREALAFQKQFLAAFHEAGVPVLLGTDSGGAGIPFVFAGFSAHEELAHFIDIGLSPYEALAAGTRKAADYLGVLDEVGTIARGKQANLILSSGNPLLDINNLTLHAGVMVRGRWIPAAEVQERLDRIAEQSRRETDFIHLVRKGGPDAALDFIERSLLSNSGLLPFREWTLNELGYEALKLDHDIDLALSLFAINAQYHPMSWSALDSLGDAHATRGDLEIAIECYARSIALFSHSPNAAMRIAKLRLELAAK